jgi:hypothetical protein
MLEQVTRNASVLADNEARRMFDALARLVGHCGAEPKGDLWGHAAFVGFASNTVGAEVGACHRQKLPVNG